MNVSVNGTKNGKKKALNKTALEFIKNAYFFLQQDWRRREREWVEQMHKRFECALFEKITKLFKLPSRQKTTRIFTKDKLIFIKTVAGIFKICMYYTISNINKRNFTSFCFKWSDNFFNKNDNQKSENTSHASSIVLQYCRVWLQCVKIWANDDCSSIKKWAETFQRKTRL